MSMHHTPHAEAIRLTELTRGGGCACKLSPDELGQVLGMLSTVAGPVDARLLVGYAESDDAAVYRLSDEHALVFTTDFFTPIVDDPYDFGRIAATNALSDVYAMGGTPVLALNLVAFPREGVPLDVLGRILEGGRRAANDAGCLVAGGHSIDDPEPKYGLAVVGLVHPDRVLTNGGGQPGDALILTKPLGIGAITTAIKRGVADPDHVGAAIATMTTSNGPAAEAAKAIGIGRDRAVHAGTDVTGFGLLGHLHELAKASGLSAVVRTGDVPLLDGAGELLAAGVVAGGTRRNHAWVDRQVDWGTTPEVLQLVLADAQTSGGLLFACRPDMADSLLTELAGRGTPAAARIGYLEAGPPGRCAVI